MNQIYNTFMEMFFFELTYSFLGISIQCHGFLKKLIIFILVIEISINKIYYYNIFFSHLKPSVATSTKTQ
jgi:hypothetical protein